METKPQTKPTDASATLAALLSAANQLATSEMERDPVPALIARRCAMQEGKPITKRDVTWLESELPGVDFSIIKSGVGMFSDTRLGWSVAVDVDDRTGEVHPSTFNGTRDEDGEPCKDFALAHKRLTLYKAGVPTRRTGYARFTISNTTTSARWPTVDALREQNHWCYSAREERNAERTANLAALVTGSGDLTSIARLVVEINLMATELRAYLETAPAELARAVASNLEISLDKVRS